MITTKSTRFKIRVLPMGAEMEIDAPGKKTFEEMQSEIEERIAQRYQACHEYEVVNIVYNMGNTLTGLDAAQEDLGLYLLHNNGGSAERVDKNTLRLNVFGADRRSLEKIYDYICKHYHKLLAHIEYNDVSFILKTA